MMGQWDFDVQNTHSAEKFSLSFPFGKRESLFVFFLSQRIVPCDCKRFLKLCLKTNFINLNAVVNKFTEYTC